MSRNKSLLNSNQNKLAIIKLDETEYKPFLASYPDELKNTSVWITNTTCGRAKINKNYVTIPDWAITNRSWDYTIYYIAHELSHIVASKNGGHMHDNIFYQCFKLICPPNCQHFELGYKPGNARLNGIKR